VKISVDAVAGGALIGKSIEAVKVLLEDMASNNYHWLSEGATLKRSGGRYDVYAVTLLVSKVDVWAQRLNRVGTPSILGSSLGSSMGVYAICEIYGVQDYTSVECYNVPFIIEHTTALHSFRRPP